MRSFEEPVVQEEPTPAVEEAVQEEVEEVAEEEDEDNEDDEKEPKKELTDEEKIAELDKLSKAHPFGLLANLAKLSNKHRAVFQIAKNEVEKDAKDVEPSMSLVARFGEVKISVPNVPGENFKFSRKIGADLLLSELYGDKHEIDLETENIKELNGSNLEVTTDADWYKEKKAEYATSCSERVDRIIKRIQKNDRFDEEAKAKKIEKFETWRNPTEELLGLVFGKCKEMSDIPQVLCWIYRK